MIARQYTGFCKTVRIPGSRPVSEDLFRQFHRAWIAGDLALAAASVHPDVVIRPLHGMFHSRSEYRGIEGLAMCLVEVVAPWDRYESRAESVHVVSANEVVGFMRLTAWKGDEQLGARVALVCGIRDGRIVSLVERDADETAELLGLAPDPSPCRPMTSDLTP